MPDVLAVLHRRVRRTAWAGFALLAVVGMWAMYPMVFSSANARSGSVQHTTGDAKHEAFLVKPLEQSVFAVALWVPPPQPPEPIKEIVQAPPPPPPPLKLQLVGIRETQFGSSAVLFDPEGSRVFTVAAGEQVQRYRVRSIDPESVVLEHADLPGQAVHNLRMRAKVSLTPATGGVAR